MTTPFMTMFRPTAAAPNEGRMMIDGLHVAASFNGGGVSTFIYDTPMPTRCRCSVSGALGEAENGGPQVNLVPKSGGNRFNGSAFYSGAGTWSSGDNLNPTLRSHGRAVLTQPASVISSWDASGSGGGPIKRDRLWFFGNLRRSTPRSRPVPGAFANLNAGDATKWTVREGSQRRGAERRFQDHLLGPAHRPGDAAQPRVVFPRVPVPVFGLDAVAERRRLPEVANPTGSASGTLTSSPESFPGYHHFPYNVTQATWPSPLTNKLLLEAGFSRFQYLWAGFGQAPPDGITNLIPVHEQSTIYGQPLFIYRGLYDPLGFAYADNDANPNNWRTTASYVTGAHNMKVGYQGSFQKSLRAACPTRSQLEYRFNNGVPNAVSYYLAPRWEQNDRTETHSLFVQDQWTKGRLTLQGGAPVRPRVELGAGGRQRHVSRRRSSIRSRSASRKP